MKKPKKKQVSLKSDKRIILFIILVIAVFLRFYKLSSLFQWSLDEEYWAYLPYNIATGYHFPLIGGHISGTGLYSGPLFVWLMAIPFFIFNGNPLGVAFFVSALGVITTYLIYLVGKKLFDENIGLLASFLAAVSPLMVIYDRKYWNATPIPLLSLLTLLSLYQIKRGKIIYNYILAIVLAVAFHAHMTSGVLLLSVFFSWILLKIPLKNKHTLTALALFIFLQLPLLVFEFRHDFINTRALSGFLTASSQASPLFRSFQDIVTLFSNTGARLIYLPANLDLGNELTLCSQYSQKKYLPTLLPILIFLTLTLPAILKRKKTDGEKLMTVMLAVNFFSLLFYRLKANSNSWYPGLLGEYYFLPIYPVIFLFFSLSLHRIQVKLKYITKLIIAVFVMLSFVSILTFKHSTGFSLKEKIVKKSIEEVGGNNFNLDVNSSDTCRIYGYRYLYTYLKNEPSGSYLDPRFSWLYQKRLPEEQATMQVDITYDQGRIEEQVTGIGN